ncbi:hypothetical protein AYO49_03255 [Verrucomicrobiaceae bacterium SCGC AG-212-N21]|nr:hypothetical protein AYO49_03255 [Verrucomicrobiaceae bacterium SCGC AG-212-N21]
MLLMLLFAPTTSVLCQEKGKTVPSAQALKLLNEPSLSSRHGAANLPVIRFISKRTFHAPFCVRAYLTPEGPRVRFARLSGKGGYDWGQLDFENDIPLPRDRWEALLKLANASGARQPFKDTKDTKGTLEGNDGSVWILEVSDKAGYTVEDVWTPVSVTEGREEDKILFSKRGGDLKALTAYVEVCKFLMKLAPFDTEPVY